MAEDRTVLELSLPIDLTAPSQARVALREAEELKARRLDLLELLVTEVVTNAVLHADQAPDESVRVIVTIKNRTARVVVEDEGEGFAPQIPETDPWATGKRGLLFLDELADRWGTSIDGKHAVWFELNLDG